MNRVLRLAAGGVGTAALAVAPLTAMAGEDHHPPKHHYAPAIEILDTYAKTIDRVVITKFVNKHGHVVKVRTKSTSKSEAAVKVAYRCFTKGHHPAEGKITAVLQNYYGSATAYCNGHLNYAYIHLTGHGTLTPGHTWVKVVLVDPQHEVAKDEESAKVEYKKVVVVKIKKVGHGHH